MTLHQTYNISGLPYFETWGEGEPLLMIHAFLFRGEMYYPILPDFTKQYKVIIPDLRGYGKNTQMSGPFSVKQMAADMRNILDYLSVSSTHVMGYSKGGVITQQLTIDYPERVKSIVLGCTFAHKPVTALERLQRMFITTALKRVGPKGLMRLISTSMADAIGKMDPETFSWYKRMVAENNEQVVVMSGHELFKFDSRPYLSKIKAPTLVIAAGDDIVTPLHHSRLLANSIPGAQIKVLEGAGHGLIHTHKEQFVKACLQFYQQLDGKGKAKMAHLHERMKGYAAKRISL